MKYTFYRPEAVSIREFSAIVEKLRCDLELMSMTGRSKKEVTHYAECLVDDALPLEHNPRMMFWGLADPRSMPSDARVDFFYTPTYLAASILMRAVLEYPELLNDPEHCDHYSMRQREKLKHVLSCALLGCTGRGFEGSGYDDLSGLMDAMKIFAHGNADAFIQQYPELCPKFTELFQRTVEMLRQGVEKGEILGAWGENYVHNAEEILTILDADQRAPAADKD